MIVKRIKFMDVKAGVFKLQLNEEQQQIIKNDDQFLNKNVTLVFYKDLSKMMQDLHNHVIEYIIMPSRVVNTNEVFDACIELVLRLNLEKVNEINTCSLDVNYVPCNIYQNQSSINDPNLLRFGKRGFIPSSEGTTKIEFKMFKNNTYKTNLLTKIYIFLFANKYSQIFSLIINIVSVLLLVIAFAFTVIPSLQGILPMEFTILADSIPLLMIVGQVLVKIFDVDEKAKRKMITGYWVYYSFEDEYSDGNYVPKGFTTRLFHITNIGGNLSLSCKFSGSDTLFFSSENNSFDYNFSTRIASGIYSYTTNMINSKGKRADGVCKYQGRSNKGDVLTYMDGWFTGRGTGIRGRVKYFRISEKDYRTLEKAYASPSQLTFKNTTCIVGIYGDVKSNTDLAFDKLYNENPIFKDVEILKKYYSLLSDMERDFKSHSIDFAIVPTSNRGKKINENQILFDYESANVVTTLDNKITYALGSRIKDYKLDKNTVFYSHRQSLKQCKEFIDSISGLTKEATSTSHAAKHISLNYTDDNVVCISNHESIEFYNLYKVRDVDVINPYINKEENVTTFTLFMYQEK